jgi:hypothetical protein
MYSKYVVVEVLKKYGRQDGKIIYHRLLNRSNDLVSPLFFPLLVIHMRYKVAEHYPARRFSKMILNVIFMLY